MGLVGRVNVTAYPLQCALTQKRKYMQTSNTFAKTKQQAIDFDGFGLQHDVANIQNCGAFFAKNATSKWSDSAAKNRNIFGRR